MGMMPGKEEVNGDTVMGDFSNKVQMGGRRREIMPDGHNFFSGRPRKQVTGLCVSTEHRYGSSLREVQGGHIDPHPPEDSHECTKSLEPKGSYVPLASPVSCCVLYSWLLGVKQEATPWGDNIMGLRLRACRCCHCPVEAWERSAL